MNIGIRCHDLCQGTIEDIISKCKEYGFENLQLVFKKALKDNNGNTILFDENSALEVGKKLKESNINVTMLGAYFNPVHSNKKLVKSNIEYFKKHLKFASLLDCKYVGTETGSYNDDKWTYNPKNQTEEGYQESIAVFKELVKYAEECNTTLLIEPAYGHVMYSVDQLKRCYDEINSPNLKITIDIFNLLYEGNYKDYKEIFRYACKIFRDNIKVFHLKDFYTKDEKIVQCGLGKGIIDFKFIIDTINEFSPHSTVVFEGVIGEDIKPSLNIIKELL